MCEQLSGVNLKFKSLSYLKSKNLFWLKLHRNLFIENFQNKLRIFCNLFDLMNLEFNVLDYAIIEGRHNSLVNATYLLVQSKFY